MLDSCGLLRCVAAVISILIRTFAAPTLPKSVVANKVWHSMEAMRNDHTLSVYLLPNTGLLRAALGISFAEFLS